MQLVANLVPATLTDECARFGDLPLTFVVVDILRASTVICTALANGAKEIITCPTVEDARALSQEDGMADALLCGERRGKKLPGFALGNSPIEYTQETVAGRRLIYASTNGSVTLAAAPEGSTVIVAGLVNLTAVASRIVALDQATVIACSGRRGMLALEDVVGAGAIIARLWETCRSLELVNDGARVAQTTWDHFKSDPGMAMWQSRHGIYLIELGFSEDLQRCAMVDDVPIVPVLRNGRLVSDSETS